jgi:thioredoxin reductase (NADPH)
MQALREEIGDEVTWQRLLARMAAGPQRFYPPWAQPTDTAAGAQRRAHSLGEFGQQLLALAGAEAADPAVRGNPGTLHHGRGAGRLEQLRLRRRDTGDTQTEPADGLFILIGAQPFTQWLPEAVARDQRGFILTGPDLAERWTLPREPYLLETSTPGVFAAGDVRHGAVKRVASAVGEGSVAIRLVHGCLA